MKELEKEAQEKAKEGPVFDLPPQAADMNIFKCKHTQDQKLINKRNTHNHKVVNKPSYESEKSHKKKSRSTDSDNEGGSVIYNTDHDMEGGDNDGPE